MRKNRFLKDLWRVMVATLVVFTFVEAFLRVAYSIRNARVAYVPLRYVIGHDYGPIPPWLDSLMILAPDNNLIWRNRPNLHRHYIDVFGPAQTEGERTSLLRRFRPTLPKSLESSPVWDISLNADGFRDAETPKGKKGTAFRIVCLGDSWTFGMNANQEQTYPQRLQALLKREFPRATFEVFNFGVLAYSSYQGLQFLRSSILDLKPDVVVIGFAMNDAKVVGYSDKDAAAYEKNLSLRDSIGRVLDKSETYKLLKYFALLSKYKRKSIGEHIKAEADAAKEADGQQDFDKPPSWTRWARVPPNDYEKNILEMIHLAKNHNASVVLLYNELWENGPYLKVLEKISSSEQVALVNSAALIAEARTKMEKDLEKSLGLEASNTAETRTNGEIEVIFRVYLGTRSVPKAVYIVGASPKLGNLVPNKIAMYDDGTHGDQRAGDAVWTYSATFPTGTWLFYVYTDSGEEGKWEGLDVPHIRSFKVGDQINEGKVYRPIESFGKIYMQADSWHTNADGYELIAKALLEVLKGENKVKDYLRDMNDNRSRSDVS